MALTSANWAEALDPTVNHWFEMGRAMRPSLLGRLYNVQTSTNSDEDVVGIGGVSIDAWDGYETSGKIGEVDFNKGYKKTYTHKEYPLKMRLQRKLYDDNKYPEIINLSRRLGQSAAQKREYDAASTFIYAFTDTGHAGADAVGLCSTAHPQSPDDSGSTQSNEGTYSLTKANVATVREAMMAFTDDKGNDAAITPNLLLVPPELEDDALVIARTQQDPGTANNDINPQNGRFEVIVWHMLTDSNAWFMIDTVAMKLSLDWFDRIPLEIKLLAQDDDLWAIWRAYMRYSFGWSDWRWIYGNNPS